MTSELTQSDKPATTWGFMMLFPLVGLLIAVALAFVGGRSLTQSQSALRQVAFQEQELRRLEMLINDLPGGVAFVEVESGVIVRCNEAFRVLTRMSDATLIGMSINKIIPAMYRSKEEQVLMDDLRIAWEKYGQDSFTLSNGQVELSDGTSIKCLIKIRGTRIAGRREWMLFVDPRLPNE